MEAVFKVLADRKRREMIHLLSEKERTVGELEKALDLSQSSTSQHLKLLNSAGLVSFRKHGNFRLYSLQTQALQEAMKFFENLWSKGLSDLKTKLEKGA